MLPTVWFLIYLFLLVMQMVGSRCFVPIRGEGKLEARITLALFNCYILFLPNGTICIGIKKKRADLQINGQIVV